MYNNVQLSFENELIKNLQSLPTFGHGVTWEKIISISCGPCYTNAFRAKKYVPTTT